MKTKKLFAHLLIWLTLGAVTFSLSHAIIKAIRLPYGVIPSQVVITMALVMLTTFAIPFYIYYAMAPNILKRTNSAKWKIAAVVIALVIPFIFIIIDEGKFSIWNYGGTLSYTLLFAFLGASLRSLFLWLNHQHKISELQNAKLKSELLLLRSQINPHFLFNTIHNIDTLIGNSPEIASSQLLKLANMMRYILFTSSEEIVPLSKEIEYIEEYISLQKLRLSENTVTYHLKEDGNQYHISPMILIPFIENAFNHFAPHQPVEGIRITIHIESGKLYLHCSNDDNKNAQPQKAHSGFGLQNVKRRLELLYASHHELIITNLNSMFDVQLSLLLK